MGIGTQVLGLAEQPSYLLSQLSRGLLIVSPTPLPEDQGFGLASAGIHYRALPGLRFAPITLPLPSQCRDCVCHHTLPKVLF